MVNNYHTTDVDIEQSMCVSCHVIITYAISTLRLKIKSSSNRKVGTQDFKIFLIFKWNEHYLFMYQMMSTWVCHYALAIVLSFLCEQKEGKNGEPEHIMKL